MITIITPVYNAENYLSKTISSILGQSCKDWEYILVDDGSTDNSLNIIKKYAEKDPRISYYSITNSGNPKIPRDYAFERSKGEYIIWIDADDYISTDLLENGLKQIEDAKADVCASICIVVTDSGERINRVPSERLNIDECYSGKELLSLSLEYPQIPMCGTLMKRELLVHKVEFAKLYMNSDELDFRKCLMNSDRIVYSHSEYYYLCNPTSISRAKTIRLFDYLATERLWKMELQSKYGCNDMLYTNFEKKRFSKLIGHTLSYFNMNFVDKKERKTVYALLRDTYRGFDDAIMKQQKIYFRQGFYFFLAFCWIACCCYNQKSKFYFGKN